MCIVHWNKSIFVNIHNYGCTIWELTAEITYVKGSVIVVLNRELCKNPGLPTLLRISQINSAIC